MKISNKIIMSTLWLAHFFNPPLKSAEEIYAHAKAHNKKQAFKVPKDAKLEYRELEVRTERGSYHCLRIKRRAHTPKRAILYIPGGGGVYDYCRHQLFLAKKLLKWVDAEIFYPFYPPATDSSIRGTYEIIFESYRAILNEYTPDKIGVFGLSFGGTAVMTMISWNNYYRKQLPMPALSIALSPGHVPANSGERKLLEAYKGVDPFIPIEQIEAYGKVQRGGEGLEPWMINTATHGDFRNAGKIVIYYGEKESLAFAAPIYRDSLEKASADYRIHVEPGMPHCYGIGRINKATRTTYDEIVAMLNEL